MTTKKGRRGERTTRKVYGGVEKDKLRRICGKKVTRLIIIGRYI